MTVSDGSFLNTAAAGDEMSFAFWQKLYNVTAMSAFWAVSPSSNNGERGFQAHNSWSDSTIYFDTAGCCNADQRLNANISTFPDYSGDPTWWNDWHYFVFSIKQGHKEIWIDGKLFKAGDGAHALPTDFTRLNIGSDNTGTSLFPHGVIDDFAVFATQLVEADIQTLAAGGSPSSLDASTRLLAYWDFNDSPPEGQFVSFSPAPNSPAAAPNLIQVVHLDGTVAWDQNNVTLKVDGAAVAATVVKDNDKGTLTFVPSPLFAIASSHKAAITYPVPGGGSQTFEWSFVVGPYTVDSVAARIGSMLGGSSYSGDGGGHSGSAGDRAIDFGLGTGPMVADASFLNQATANDEMSFAFWSKKYDIANGSVFWANAPSKGGPTGRGWQAHLPWSNNNIYFDTSGCCGGNQRINKDIGGFQPYVDAGTGIAWWNDWHYYVFSDKAGHKEIWIDGQLFHSGDNQSPLAVDFTTLFVGSDGGGGGLFHGLIDDFAVFSTQLVEADILNLAGGAKASSLDPATGLIGYWQFDDFPAEGLFVSFSPAPDQLGANPNLIQVVHQQGSKGWDLSKVSLLVDGVKVAATATLDQGRVTVTYVPSPLFAAKSTHTAVLNYPGPGADLLSKTWKFTVGQYTLDSVASYLGVLTGAASFTDDGGGRSGSPGDFGLDFGKNQTGQSVSIADASFLNAAGANDEIAIGGWQKLYGIHDSAFFWGVSPTSNGGSRGFGTHAPWSNNNLYWDTAGCCDGSQRTSKDIGTFQPYIDFGQGQAWWQDWHYFLFQKKGATKEIWIDGQLFTSGQNSKVLPVDFTRAYIGLDPVDANAAMQGILDDVAVFKNALEEGDIIALAGGTAPGDISAGGSLIAYFTFNDGGTAGIRLHISGDDKTVNLTWTGGTGPYTVQHKANLSDAQWDTVTTTAELKATVNVQGATGFFRITVQ
ncbi:MAG: hypothetical protein HYR88_09310 [Verrucomicrobia bacterium]|nr:hypothetical protein [Verrucomicrobiota bacterium]